MPQPRRGTSIARRNTLRRAAGVALVLAVLVSLAGCGKKADARRPRVTVSVARAQQRTVPFSITATGTVEAMRTADVGAQVGGVVRRVAFREGQDVNAGDLLFELDARTFRAALEQAQATLQKDRAQATAARLDLERSRALLDQQLLSDAEWDQKQAASQTWDATVRADSADMLKAKLNVEYASIRAPIPGRTGQLLVHEGDLVLANSKDPLVTINQVQPVRVRFTVPVSDVPLVQRYRNANPTVIVTGADEDSASHAGRLVFVDNAVDPATGTLLLKGEFANKDRRLVPGQFVDVKLVLFSEKNQTVVPAVAVTRGQQGAYVFVMNPDSTVTSRPVAVSRTVDEMSVVSDGLKPGETVITDGQLRLSPGARVMVRAPVGSTP